MPKTSTSRVPSYRRHKPTGQAVVTINGQDIYLGKWNTAASRAEYDRLIAEFLANGRRLQSDADGTVVEVLNAYRKFAENYYRKGGRVTSEYGAIKDALKLVRELYGRTSSFSTAHLKHRRTRPIDLLIVPRDQPLSIMRCRTAFNARGPNSLAVVRPYSSRTSFNASLMPPYSLVTRPSLR